MARCHEVASWKAIAAVYEKLVKRKSAKTCSIFAGHVFNEAIKRIDVKAKSRVAIYISKPSMKWRHALLMMACEGAHFSQLMTRVSCQYPKIIYHHNNKQKSNVMLYGNVK